MKKKRIYKQLNYSSYDLSYRTMTLEEIKQFFTKEFETVHKLYPEYDTIRIELYPEEDYGSAHLEIRFYGERDETDEEYALNLQRNKHLKKVIEKRKQDEETKERAQLAKLKAKYENNV